jgi:hypothetical protein
MEIHEQPWCPSGIRNGATDYLRFIEAVGRQYQHVIPLLQPALRRSGSVRIVDLCSGSGGPWPQLQHSLNVSLPAPIPVLLTDLHPNQATLKVTAQATPYIQFISTPVNALQIPAHLTGFRTLFTAFHHFEPQAARSILQAAVNQGQGIGLFEQTARTPLALLTMLLLPWLSVLAAPFVQPFRWDRLFWTVVIPVIPLVLCCDGLVSCLRTYSTAELWAMVAALNPPLDGTRYQWEIGRVPSPLSPIGVTYAIGYPLRVVQKD